MSNKILKEIESGKIIAILRKISEKSLLPLVGALLDGGIKLIEITFDQKGDPLTTARGIDRICGKYGGSIQVGAGTVMTVEQAELAHKSGAGYIISPNTDPAVIGRTKELGMISIPGALTPTEIVAAHDIGADIVKLFPAGELGMNYIKALTAPITHIPLMAVGGVNLGNIAEFFKAGLMGVGIGSAITPKNLIENGDFDKITQLARGYINAAKGE